MRHGQVELDWADGTYSFRLTLASYEEVEEKCDASLYEIVERLSNRTCRLKHIREVLRCGLIGAGMAPADALRKVRQYVDERPVEENRDTALAVALAGIARVFTVETKPAGEQQAAESLASTSPPSMEQPQ